MHQRTLGLAATLIIAVLTAGGCQLNDEIPTTGTDLVIANGGSYGLSKVTVNGVDQGALEPGDVLTMEDVGEGSFVIQAYLNASDAEPCATFQTPELAKGEPAHHTFDCSKP